MTDPHLLAEATAKLDLDDGWHLDTAPPGTAGARYLHDDGHHIGLRPIFKGLIIQTWITAGPLPEEPEPEQPAQKAEAQRSRHARLQPGRSWHVPISTRDVDDLGRVVGDVIRTQLIPALTNKPKSALILTHSEARDNNQGVKE